MSLRRRFLLTFFSLVFLGVMAISSYSILFVRSHLLRTSRDSLDQQARYLATLLESHPDEEEFLSMMTDYARYTEHTVELLDANFRVQLSAGAIGDSTLPLFSGIAALPGSSTENRQYVRITASEAEIRDTLTNVRYIIYAGIFGALLLTVVVSWVVADRISLPIRQLADAARQIAGGHRVDLPQSDRTDEIGDLTRDVAAMADRLQQDIQDLKGLNQAQEDFIAALSHEVRNPVFSARGYLEMALEEVSARTEWGAERDQLREYLQKSHKNLLRIHSLFADMLQLVRLEFNQEPVQLTRIALDQVVAELEETFLPQAQERGIALKIQADSQAVQGQAELLKVALSNLLSNAIRHTARGEVRLAITRLDHDRVRLEVSDTGEGIPPDQLARIFDKFYRVDKARSREQGGTGLGLSLVQQCMRTLGTEIKVDSKVGAGSRFWFDLQAG